MSACSFGGNWLGGPALAWLFAVVAALLLAPVGIGALIGWRIERRKGRPWFGMFKGGAWVLGTYLALVALWWAAQYAEQLQRAARDRAEHALVDPVRSLQPGGWTALLAANDPSQLPQSERQAWIFAVQHQASRPLAWTVEDLDALDALALRLARLPAGRTAASAIAGIVAFRREGEAGLARVREECDEDAGCVQAIDNALDSHDQMLLVDSAALLWQAQPVPAELRAALERLLARQRAQAGDWGNHGDARLAFDRASRGHLRHALEACGAQLPLAPGQKPGYRLDYCWATLLPALESHAVARLCPAGGGLDADDAQVLAEWRAAAEAWNVARIEAIANQCP